MTPLRTAGQFLIAAGILHMALLIWWGLAPGPIIFATIAILTGALLTRGWRWLGYPMLLISGIAAIVETARMGLGPEPIWLTILIALALALTALSLFRALWYDRTAA